MTTQTFWIIIVLIVSNFLLAISKQSSEEKVKMTIMYGIEEFGTRKSTTIYDTDFKYCRDYENAEIVLYADSEVLGLKKGKYKMLQGQFVERLN